MNALVLLLSLTAHADNGCDNYCVGVRGNGEAEPAHPAALARMVEDFGMPKTLAGGSSATITMFLTEQVKANPKASAEADPERKRKLQALLLKSMPEFEAAITKDAKVSDAFGLMKAMSGDTKMKEDAIKALGSAGAFSPAELQKVMAKYGPLLNPELVRLVEKDPEKFGPEAVKSVKNLGKFNAVTDDTIFFRPGLVDFKGIAVVLGYMGDFYAGNVDDATKKRLDGFLDGCSESTFHKEWSDSSNDDCRTQFQSIAGDYLAGNKFANKALFDKVGAHGDSLPTTSVLQGEGVTKYLNQKRAYENGTAQNIGDFSVDFKKDMAFGYWGRDEQLAAADKGLEKYREQGDAKAKKFRGLGTANWFEVLSVSPAEPGIANAQRIPTATTREQVLAELEKPIEKRWTGLHYRKDVISTGGWSDLHPTAILKTQAGCDRVVYLTRHADYGDSKFGQQIFIRLTGTKKQIPFWDHIGDSNPSGWCDTQVKAAGGDPDVVRTTPWSQINNLCNPQSSFRRALDLADATACTDWDSDKNDVFKGNMRSLVKDAYESPLIPTKPAGMACAINTPAGALDARALPGCLPYSARQPGSKPTPEIGDGASGTESAQ
jgi:hypothetical protein